MSELNPGGGTWRQPDQALLPRLFFVFNAKALLEEVFWDGIWLNLLWVWKQIFLRLGTNLITLPKFNCTCYRAVVSSFKQGGPMVEFKPKVKFILFNILAFTLTWKNKQYAFMQIFDFFFLQVKCFCIEFSVDYVKENIFSYVCQLTNIQLKSYVSKKSLLICDLNK